MIRGVVALTAAAAMAPAPPVQRKPVRPVVAVRAIGTVLRAILALRAVLIGSALRRLLMLRLAAGDE
jgi:hypothetical protein